MSFILNIHTTTETAIVNICNGENVLDTLVNSDQKQHAAFLHTAIHQILQNNDIPITSLQAVGTTIGPGSYTGIRVGLATAKGLCFSLKIPLLTFNTLEVLTDAATYQIRDNNSLYCPMIDARRMEVFTAIYDSGIKVVYPPSAMVLEETSFADLLEKRPVYFFGSGSRKFQNLIVENLNARFIEQEITTEALARFGWKNFIEKSFSDIAYTEAFYIKDFHTTVKK